MIPAVNYNDICYSLRDSFHTRYKRNVAVPETKPARRFSKFFRWKSSASEGSKAVEIDQSRDSVRMTGILFALPTASLAASEIVPNMEYFYHRTADNIDFFCAGYGGPSNFYPTEFVVRGDYFDWSFSSEKFNELRKQIESLSTWKFSGGVDLILANARFDRSNDRAYIDFESALVCRLDEMKQDGAITGVGTFFESIARFAESSSGDDPTWGFSDREGLKTAGSALKRLVLSLLPKKLGEDVKRVSHFAVHDVSKST